MDWSALDRSAASEKPDHDSINRAKPVVLTDERLRCSETLFKGFHPRRNRSSSGLPIPREKVWHLRHSHVGQSAIFAQSREVMEATCSGIARSAPDAVADVDDDVVTIKDAVREVVLTDSARQLFCATKPSGWITVCGAPRCASARPSRQPAGGADPPRS